MELPIYSTWLTRHICFLLSDFIHFDKIFANTCYTETDKYVNTDKREGDVDSKTKRSLASLIHAFNDTLKLLPDIILIRSFYFVFYFIPDLLLTLVLMLVLLAMPTLICTCLFLQIFSSGTIVAVSCSRTASRTSPTQVVPIRIVMVRTSVCSALMQIIKHLWIRWIIKCRKTTRITPNPNII